MISSINDEDDLVSEKSVKKTAISKATKPLPISKNKKYGVFEESAHGSLMSESKHDIEEEKQRKQEIAKV